MDLIPSPNGRCTTPRSTRVRHCSTPSGFSALRFRGPGTDLTVGTLQTITGGRAARQQPRTASSATPTFQRRKSSRLPIWRASDGMVRKHQAAVVSRHADSGHRACVLKAAALSSPARETGSDVLSKVLSTDEGRAAARRSGRWCRIRRRSRKAAFCFLQHALRRKRREATSARLGRAYTKCNPRRRLPDRRNSSLPKAPTPSLIHIDWDDRLRRDRCGWRSCGRAEATSR